MCNMKLLGYNIFETVITAPGQVNFDNHCNGWVIKNTGTTLVLIMGESLATGESKSIGGNYGEIWIGRLNIAFRTPTPAPSVITNQATLTQKIYVRSTDFI